MYTYIRDEDDTYDGGGDGTTIAIAIDVTVVVVVVIRYCRVAAMCCTLLDGVRARECGRNYWCLRGRPGPFLWLRGWAAGELGGDGETTAAGGPEEAEAAAAGE